MPKGIDELLVKEALNKLINFFTRAFASYLPNAFVFSLLLTLLVFIAGMSFTSHSVLDLIDFWGRDFWSLNSFAMQMIFILLTGHMLASAPPVRKFLRRLSLLATTEKRALILVSVFSSLSCWINWGFGLIVSSIIAVEVAKKLKKVNFALLVATAYSGFLLWHGGLSGSIPLKVAGKDEILSNVFPHLILPLSETIFSFQNLLILILLFISLPILAIMMMGDQNVEFILPTDDQTDETQLDLSWSNLEINPLINWILFILFGVYIFIAKTPFDINRVNLIFLCLTFIFYKTPRDFLRGFESSISYTGGIILQFPFYAGIMGLMQYSGLADQLSLFIIDFSTIHTLPFWTFISAGVVNFFIPSGGGQWVIQGPVVLKAAQSLGVNPAKVVIAMSWGDAWTNMLQPFWALPLLAIARIELKNIMGYCLMITFFSGVVISLVMLIF